MQEAQQEKRRLGSFNVRRSYSCSYGRVVWNEGINVEGVLQSCRKTERDVTPVRVGSLDESTRGV